ncbi:TIGR04255 family protein [Streptomyces viridochromogenes]|uniref:TIGR04255 family protein n=1 Tax=Streptomyces viridochromogenes TaxID=1938 RepID=UPI0009976236|nr:TIGR04255 family protein [Streptomyces viridochromogenes]
MKGAGVKPVSGWLTREPEDRHLSSPPVALVVCQVRHETEYAASDASRALRIKGALDWPTELTENLVQGVNVAVGQFTGFSASQSPAMRTWQLKSQDGTWTVSLQPDHFSLETTRYGGWSQFRDRLTQLAKAVGEHVAPALEHRVGLRYVNQIRHPDVLSPLDWRNFISEELFQEKLYEDLGDSFRAAMQVVEAIPSAHHSLVIRHGLQLGQESEFTYVLDNDSARQGSRPFDVQSIMTTVDQLHLDALRAFEMGTTETLRDHFA